MHPDALRGTLSHGRGVKPLRRPRCWCSRRPRHRCASSYRRSFERAAQAPAWLSAASWAHTHRTPRRHPGHPPVGFFGPKRLDHAQDGWLPHHAVYQLVRQHQNDVFWSGTGRDLPTREVHVNVTWALGWSTFTSQATAGRLHLGKSCAQCFE